MNGTTKVPNLGSWSMVIETCFFPYSLGLSVESA